MMRVRHLLVVVCVIVVACLPCMAKKIPLYSPWDLWAVGSLAVGFVPVIGPALAVTATATGVVGSAAINIAVNEINTVNWESGPLAVLSYRTPLQRLKAVFSIFRRRK